MGNYVIDIYVHGGDSDADYSANYPESMPKANPSKQDNVQESGWQKFQGAYKQVTKAYASMSLVRNMFAFELSRVGVEQGNDVAQNRINFAMEVAGQIGTVAGAFVLGGPVAGIAALASVGIGYMQKAKVIEYEKGVESIALQEMRTRAGVSYNRHRSV